MPETERKIVVLLPTKYALGRHKYLNLTLQTLLEHASRSSSKVEIVVSDASENGAENNERVVQKLHGRFPKTPIHYFPPGAVKEVEETLRHATQQEKNAFASLVPKDGDYGANRNRLAALGVLVGGRNAAYLHLDDDMPMGKLNDRGELRKHRGNPFDFLIPLLERSEKKGFKGFTTVVVGLKGLALAESGRESVKQELRESVRPILAGVLYNTKNIGSTAGRTYSFSLMQVPYEPYGINEDHIHAIHPKIFGNLAKVPTSFLVHIGRKPSKFKVREEVTPGGIVLISVPLLEKTLGRKSVEREIQVGWNALIRRLSRARKH